MPKRTRAPKLDAPSADVGTPDTSVTVRTVARAVQFDDELVKKQVDDLKELLGHVADAHPKAAHLINDAQKRIFELRQTLSL